MLEEAQRFFYSTTQTNCPEHVRFLFIETDAEQETAHIMGAPKGRRALESFPTPIEAAEAAVAQLRKKVRVRMQPVEAPPEDSCPLIEIKDFQVTPVAIEKGRISEALFGEFAHVLDFGLMKMPPVSFEPIKEWFTGIALQEGFLNIKKTGDVIDVFIPEAVPEKIMRRIEIMFNEVELITTEEQKIRWIPDAKKMAFAGAGAGGMRSFGRIALWSRSRDGAGLYLQNLIEKIRSLYQDLCNLGAEVEPVVYLAGTFTGGTNSGMFIDIAYACRDIIDPPHTGNPPVMGLFLLPPVACDDRKSVSNAYACLQDLDHFTQEDSQFMAKWPLGVSRELFPEGKTPFGLTTLMSLSWVPDGDIKSLYRVAGMFLYLMGSGFMSYRKAKIIDVAGEGENVWKFSAVGMACLFYPRGEVRICAAGEVAIERLIQIWNDPKKCQGAKLQEVSNIDQVFNDRRRSYREVVDNSLDSAFLVLSRKGPDGDTVSTRIRTFLGRVAKRMQAFDRDALIAFLGTDSELYQAGRASAQNAVEALETQIGEVVIKELERTECLAFAIRLLQEIINYLEEILKYWSSLRVLDWDNALEGSLDQGTPEDLISDLIVGQGQLLGEARKVRVSRMLEVVQKMHMSLLAPEIRKLIGYLRTGDIEGPREGQRTVDPMKVPSIAALHQLRDQITAARDGIRKIQSGVADGVRPNELINYHFTTGSFQGEVAEAKRQFDEAYSVPDDAQSRSADLLGYGAEETLWTMLVRFLSARYPLDSWMVDEVSKRFLARDLPSPGDGSIYANNDLRRLAQTAKNNVSVKLGVATENLSNAPTHPKVTVVDRSTNQQILEKYLLEKCDETAFKCPPDSCAEMMKDMVLFFDERPVARLRDMAMFDMWRPVYTRRKSKDASVDCYIHT